MNSQYSLKHYFFDFMTMLVVSGLSLFLLIYVGFGEAKRTYEQLQFEKLLAQGQIVQNAMEKVLRPGLPLRQYVGFGTLAERILASDESIAAIIAYDINGTPVFSSGDSSVPLLSSNLALIDNIRPGDPDKKFLQVILPLRNRFEQIGSLTVTIPRMLITHRVESGFKPLLITGAGLAVAFSLFITLFRARLARKKAPWLQISFAATFLVMSIVVIVTLVMLYSEGAQAKTKALADTLGQRLSDIVTFNLVVNDIVGLDQLFGDYQRLNPDIKAAALIVDGKIVIHTDSKMLGRKWAYDKTNYEYIVDLTPPGSVREIRTAVVLPFNIVFERTTRSIKNFAALFVASAFLAGLFLQLASSLPSLYRLDSNAITTETIHESEEALLDLAKPVFFVAVFIEHLTYSFLPQFIERIVSDGSMSSTYLSLPFIIYYVFFALSLVPAGHIAEQISPRPLMYGGMLLSAIGLSLLILPPDIYMVILARAISGLGQGILFIGVQTYILMTVSPSKRTQGVSIIVFGFQGGMISGLAIGSLLMPYLGERGVFMLCGAIGVSMTMYTLAIVPSLKGQITGTVSLKNTMQELMRNMAQVSRSLRFLKAMILVGIPAKTVLTGVIIFALPLILAQKKFHQEDIGQIIMIYGASVLISTHYFSRLVDRIGRSHLVLFWGSVISGIGIILIGLIDWQGTEYFVMTETLSTGVLITGVAITGFSHGLINAPVVTHIAESRLANRIGPSTATATYRFMERIGHIAGPMLIGQLFVLGGQNAMLLTWVGAGIIIFGIIFIIGSAPPQLVTSSEARPQ